MHAVNWWQKPVLLALCRAEADTQRLTMRLETQMLRCIECSAVAALHGGGLAWPG